MKQMTKKELEAFIENKWGKLCNEYGRGDSKYNNVFYVDPLCKEMPATSGWLEYWHQINTDGQDVIWRYFNHDASCEEDSILRLITLHLFVRHKFPERKKKRGVKK